MMSRSGRRWLGLSIVVGGLALAAPAAAQDCSKAWQDPTAEATAKTCSIRWKLKWNESFCLGVARNDMTPGTPLVTWDCVGDRNQAWSLYRPAGFPPGDKGRSAFQLWTHASTAPTGAATDQSSRCIAMENGGSVDEQTRSIVWSCSAKTLDQGWDLVPAEPDGDGHPCFFFRNLKAFYGGTDLRLSPSSPAKGEAVRLWEWTSTTWCAYEF